MAFVSLVVDDWIPTKQRLAEAVHQLSQLVHNGPERRPLFMSVEVLPLDEEYRPLVNPALNMFTCDISAEGLGLIYVHVIESRYLALTIHGVSGQPVRLLTEGVRCEATDADPRLYRIGTRFMTR